MALAKPSLSLALAFLVAAFASAQSPPSREDQQKLAKEYLSADPARAAAIETSLAGVPALSKADAAAWVAWIRKALKAGGPKIDLRGTNYFYDEKEKKGKYIVAGGDNKKGLIFGLHGGGVGSADCTGAASAFGGVVQKAGMVGIFPEAMKATEAAWGDDETVQFMLDLLAAARRTIDFDPDRVYVIGHSMGGYGAWTWGGRFGDRLAAAVSFAGSPTPIFDDAKQVTGIQDGVVPNLRNVPFWSYHSADDPQVPIAATRFAIGELKKFHEADPLGYEYRYEEVNGRKHDFPAKGPGPAIEWMANKKRETRPKKVVWQSFYCKPEQSYWLRVEKPKRGVTIEAEWDGKSSFTIINAAPGEVGVLLDDQMTDLDKPVKLVVGKETVFSDTPRRLLVTLLRSARSRGDPGHLFSARVPAEAP